MPGVDGGAYLVGYLWEMGPTVAAGDRQAVLNHEAILAWQALIGVELEPWEVRFLRRLSGEYLTESHRAQQRDCPAPLRTQSESERDLNAVAKSMQQTLRELAKL